MIGGLDKTFSNSGTRQEQVNESPCFLGLEYLYVCDRVSESTVAVKVHVDSPLVRM